MRGMVSSRYIKQTDGTFFITLRETFEKCLILFKIKEDDPAMVGLTTPSTICRTYGAGRHTEKYFED